MALPRAANIVRNLLWGWFGMKGFERVGGRSGGWAKGGCGGKGRLGGGGRLKTAARKGRRHRNSPRCAVGGRISQRVSCGRSVSKPDDFVKKFLGGERFFGGWDSWLSGGWEKEIPAVVQGDFLGFLSRTLGKVVGIGIGAGLECGERGGA